MVQYVGVENLIQLIRSVGVETFLTELATYVEEDFCRWPTRRRAWRAIPAMV